MQAISSNSSLPCEWEPRRSACSDQGRNRDAVLFRPSCPWELVEEAPMLACSAFHAAKLTAQANREEPSRRTLEWLNSLLSSRSERTRDCRSVPTRVLTLPTGTIGTRLVAGPRLLARYGFLSVDDRLGGWRGELSPRPLAWGNAGWLDTSTSGVLCRYPYARERAATTASTRATMKSHLATVNAPRSAQTRAMIRSVTAISPPLRSEVSDYDHHSDDGSQKDAEQPPLRFHG